MGVGTFRRHRNYHEMPQPVLQPEKEPVGGYSKGNEPVQPSVEPVSEPVAQVAVTEAKPAKPSKLKAIVDKVEQGAVEVAVVALEVAKQN